MVHGCQMSRLNMSESGFVTAGHKPTWHEQHASEGLITQFQNQAIRVPGLRSVLAVDVIGTGSRGLVLSEFVRGALTHKPVVPKLCCTLESLGILTKQNENWCLAPTPRHSDFIGLGWDLGIRIFKSSSGDCVGQPSLGVKSLESLPASVWNIQSFGTSGVLTILQNIRKRRWGVISVISDWPFHWQSWWKALSPLRGPKGFPSSLLGESWRLVLLQNQPTIESSLAGRISLSATRDPLLIFSWLLERFQSITFLFYSRSVHSSLLLPLWTLLLVLGDLFLRKIQTT